MSASLVLVGSAAAQPEEAGREPPARVIAWVEFDPRGLGAGADDPIAVLVERGVAGLAFGVVATEPGAADAARRAWEALRGEPGAWRAALLDAGGSASPRGGGAERSFTLDRLAAVFEAEPGEARSADTERRARGAVGGAARVAAEDGRITIAVGDGSLDRWRRERGGAEPRAWQAHRVQAAIAARTPARGLTVLEAWADLNALREGLPDAFEGTTLSRLLQAWRLMHARAVMLHVHLVPAAEVEMDAPAPYPGPPLLAVELTWESRTEPPGAVHALSIARATWPGKGVGLIPQQVAYAIVARLDLGMVLRSILGTYRSCGSEFEAMSRATRISMWDRSHGPAASRLVEASSGWMMAWKPAREQGEAGSALWFLAPLRPDSGVQAEQDLAEISGSIHPGVRLDRQRQWWVADLPGVTIRWMQAGNEADGRVVGILACPARGP